MHHIDALSGSFLDFDPKVRCEKNPDIRHFRVSIHLSLVFFFNTLADNLKSNIN
jgi:hypothetical protein